MSLVSVFQCDGPTCVASDDEGMDEAGIREAGWLIVSFNNQDDEDESVECWSHFCSYACLEAWARENAMADEAA